MGKLEDKVTNIFKGVYGDLGDIKLEHIGFYHEFSVAYKGQRAYLAISEVDPNIYIKNKLVSIKKRIDGYIG